MVFINSERRRLRNILKYHSKDNKIKYKDLLKGLSVDECKQIVRDSGLIPMSESMLIISLGELKARDLK